MSKYKNGELVAVKHRNDVFVARYVSTNNDYGAQRNCVRSVSVNGKGTALTYHEFLVTDKEILGRAKVVVLK